MTNHKQDPREISTTTVLKETLSELRNQKDYKPTCNREDCIYIKEQEKSNESFFDAKLLKIMGIVYGIASPFICWLVVSVFTMQSDIKLIQQKQEMISEIKSDLLDIKRDIIVIKVDMASIKRNQGP